MGPVLNCLVKLQSVENRLRAAKSKLSRCRRSVIFQENKVRSLQNQLESKQEEIKLTKVQSDRLELELRSREEDVAKMRAALNTAKTNKEYSTILTQMNTSKADNSKVESQVLELFKIIEADEAECDEVRGQIEEEKSKLEDIRRDADEKAVDYEKEIAEIEVEWKDGSGELPGDVLDVFKRLADTYDGESIALAEQQDGSENYTCGGCFMSLRLDIINTLMTKDEVIRCPNCTRIVVLKEEQI